MITNAQLAALMVGLDLTLPPGEPGSDQAQLYRHKLRGALWLLQEADLINANHRTLKAIG